MDGRVSPRRDLHRLGAILLGAGEEIRFREVRHPSDQIHWSAGAFQLDTDDAQRFPEPSGAGGGHVTRSRDGVRSALSIIHCVLHEDTRGEVPRRRGHSRLQSPVLASRHFCERLSCP